MALSYLQSPIKAAGGSFGSHTTIHGLKSNLSLDFISLEEIKSISVLTLKLRIALREPNRYILPGPLVDVWPVF